MALAKQSWPVLKLHSNNSNQSWNLSYSTMTPAQKKKGWIRWPRLQIRIPLEFQRQLAAWGEIACTYCSYTERFLGCWQIWNSTWIWQIEGIWRADMRQTPMSGTHQHHSSLSSFKFVPSGIILWCMHLFCVEAPSSTHSPWFPDPPWNSLLFCTGLSLHRF